MGQPKHLYGFKFDCFGDRVFAQLFSKILVQRYLICYVQQSTEQSLNHWYFRLFDELSK